MEYIFNKDDIFQVFIDEAGNVWQSVFCEEIQFVIDEEDKNRFSSPPKKKQEYFKNPPLEIIEDEEIYILNYD